MIPVSIETLAIGWLPQPSVITLRPANAEGAELADDRVLPICVGPTEATAIAAALDSVHNERPLTHATANNLLQAAGGSIIRAVIDRVEGTTFYATIYVRCGNGLFTRVDSRPSDAIALAICADKPLFVEEAVMEAASNPRALGGPGAEKQVELEEFHKFIEGLNPDDFVKNEDH